MLPRLGSPVGEPALGKTEPFSRHLDELSQRFLRRKYSLGRTSIAIATYSLILHEKESRGPVLCPMCKYDTVPRVRVSRREVGTYGRRGNRHVTAEGSGDQDEHGIHGRKP